MLESRDESRALLAFAAAVFVFHHLPSLAGEAAGDWIDLLTPFAVIGAAAFVIGPGRSPVLVTVAAGFALAGAHDRDLGNLARGHAPVQRRRPPLMRRWWPKILLVRYLREAG